MSAFLIKCPEFQFQDLATLGKVNSSTGVLDSGGTLAKKCKNCDSNELRYHFASLSCSCSEHGVKEQLIKAKIENCTRANEELAQKIALLKKKNAIRASVLQMLYSTDGSHINGDQELSLLNNNGDLNGVVLDIILRKVNSMLPPDASVRHV